MQSGDDVNIDSLSQRSQHPESRATDLLTKFSDNLEKMVTEESSTLLPCTKSPYTVHFVSDSIANIDRGGSPSS